MSRSGSLYLIAGGGTGGHIFPGLAVAAELVRAGHRVEFVGTARGLEAKLIPEHGYRLRTLPVRGMAGKSLGARLHGAALLPVAIWRASRLLGKLRPSGVLGVGGYASGPVIVAAWLRRIRCVIHEQNARPGVTNRLAARLADKVAVSFASSRDAFPRAADTVMTGNPVRREFFAAKPCEPGDPVRLLLFGGSQGAHILNLRMTEALSLLSGIELGIVHQTGERDHSWVQEAYAASPFRGAVVVRFLDDMPRELEAADLVVARAGATTVAELAAAGRAALLVPFAAATGGHQAANARALVNAGGAEILLERELTSGSLAQRLKALASDPERLRQMGEAARRHARPDAARAVAELLLDA